MGPPFLLILHTLWIYCRIVLDLGLGAAPKQTLGVIRKMFTLKKCQLVARKLKSGALRSFHPIKN